MNTIKRISLSVALLLSLACNTIQQYILPGDQAPEYEATEFPSGREGEDGRLVPHPADLPIAPKLNNLAPNFVLEDTEGNTYELWELRGRPVLLNFWATWCGPCLREMPAIESLAGKYPDLVVLAINGDGESSEAIRGYREEHGLNFPLLIDANENVSDDYRIVAFPTSFFIDRQGVIRHIRDGSMSEAEFEQIVASTILGKSAETTTNSGLAIDFPSNVWSFDISEEHVYEYRTLSEQSFSNYTLQTDVEITDRASEYHGLILRWQDSENFYSFRITPDGYFAFDVWHSGKYSFERILGPTHSDAIHQGTAQINTLAVVASNESFDLYINGQYVASASDSRFASGKVGVMSCTCDGSRSTSSTFSNFSLASEP